MVVRMIWLLRRKCSEASCNCLTMSPAVLTEAVFEATFCFPNVDYKGDIENHVLDNIKSRRASYMRINTVGFTGEMNIAFDRALAVIVAERISNMAESTQYPSLHFP